MLASDASITQPNIDLVVRFYDKSISFDPSVLAGHLIVVLVRRYPGPRPDLTVPRTQDTAIGVDRLSSSQRPQPLVALHIYSRAIGAAFRPDLRPLAHRRRSGGG